MSTAAVAALASGSSQKALWYLTRSTGIVALLLLTATVVLGIIASVGWTTERWPRFLSQTVHRDLSLLCVTFVAVHVLTTVSDGYVPIGVVDAVVPFRTAYRPLYVGFGALAFDLMLAVLVTSALRRRIGYTTWRFVHWLSYLCWPIAMVHGLGSGSDATQPVVVLVDIVCTGAVVGALAWRLVTGRTLPVGRRTAAAVGATATVLAIGIFASVGPLRPGWSRRAGTSSALLAQLARRNATAPTGGTASSTTTPAPSSSGSSSVPSAPFTVGITGSQSVTQRSGGEEQVTLTLHLQDPSSTPLTLVLTGTPVEGGGVAMTSGSVSLGPYSGQVTSLSGGTIGAFVRCLGPLAARHVPQRRPELRRAVRNRVGDRIERRIGWEPVTPPAPSNTVRRNRSRLPTAPGPTGVDRLLAGVGTDDQPGVLSAHLDRWGPLPSWKGPSFIDELDRSGLRGHGGAWFPVATKWRSVRRSLLRGPVIVANGAESEPASGKDRILIERVPHLVLDGAVVAARTLGASQVYVHVPSASVPSVRRALDERRRLDLDDCNFEVVVAPDRFLAGQETAVVNTIMARRPATPTFAGVRTIREQGVRGRPTLVQNVESLAHVALIARYGAKWFRTVGTPECPGTALLTVTGRWDEPRVIEVPLGVPLASALQLGPDEARGVQGLLLGGYGGGWLTTAEAMTMPLSEEAARQRGSSIGAGVVALLPAGSCPLAEVSRVVGYLEGEGAGQCGPCVNGLAAIANSVERLAFRPSALRGGIADIPTLCGLVEGRGACRHPDGVARFVRSSLRVFADHATLHLQRGPCRSDPAPFLPLRGTAPRRERR